MFDSDFESAPGAFWETLGQYVYGYKENDEWVYIGKGNFNRALSHIGSKDYDTDNLYIIARNLEKFKNEKKDVQSFILESFLISKNDPRDNSVAGHHKECFIMAKFSELFDEFKKDQHDNFETMPDWFTENYETFAGKLNVIVVKSSHHLLEFATRQQLQPSFEVSTEGNVSLRVGIWSKPEFHAQKLGQLEKFCNELDIDPSTLNKTGNREIYEIDPGNMTIEKAVEFIKDFFS
jgi:hypothetical protein